MSGEEGHLHTVAQGECFALLAEMFNLPGWRTIYAHAKNAELRNLRPNPDVIYPGDRVYIPAPRQRSESASTETTNRYRKICSPVKIDLHLQDEDGEPLAGLDFWLKAGDSLDIRDVVPDDGHIEYEVPANTVTARMSIWPDPDDEDNIVCWDIQLGNLDPTDTVSGVQARLNNLGYDSGSVDGDAADMTNAAVARFQARAGLTVDGIAGPKTQKKLEEFHQV